MGEGSCSVSVGLPVFSIQGQDLPRLHDHPAPQTNWFLQNGISRDIKKWCLWWYRSLKSDGLRGGRRAIHIFVLDEMMIICSYIRFVRLRFPPPPFWKRTNNTCKGGRRPMEKRNPAKSLILVAIYPAQSKAEFALFRAGVSIAPTWNVLLASRPIT